MKAPFPYFGGKRDVAAMIWRRLGSPKQYIEPFCGSAAVLLAAPAPASLEVLGDANGFVANFWRATVHQPAAVARAADYPVSHVDLGARHRWLMDQRGRLGAELQDPDWPGDAKVAGWWLWGQCCWIGSGWCEWDRAAGKIPHVSDAGRGIQAAGQIPHVSDAGMGVQAAGKVPHTINAGTGIHAVGAADDAMGEYWTSAGLAADRALRAIAARLERCRVVHGDWRRCLNHHYGGDDTAVFLDPPYEGFGEFYGAGAVASDVAAWARENANLRIALCGHRGDYELAGWTAVEWERTRLTYASDATKAEECIWFSPACLPDEAKQRSLFDLEATA